MDDVLQKLKKELIKLGVKNVDNPSSQDIKIILNSYLKDKKLSIGAFNTYVNTISPTLKIIFEGLKQFVESDEKISDKTITIINHAITILGDELKKELNENERAEIRYQIITLVNDARKESDEHRSIIKASLTIAGGAIIVIAGVTVLIATRGKGASTIVKGAGMIARALPFL
jgi:hypothetical protein